VELNDTCAYNYARILERKSDISGDEERGPLHTSLCARCDNGVVYRPRDHLDVIA